MELIKYLVCGEISGAQKDEEAPILKIYVFQFNKQRHVMSSILFVAYVTFVL